MAIRFFIRDEVVSAKIAEGEINKIVPRQMMQILAPVVSDSTVKFGTSTSGSPINISNNDPDANPDRVAEANAANQLLSKKGSDLRIMVEE